MRFALIVLLFSATLGSMPAYAVSDVTALMIVQEQCAQVGEISFGPNRRWADCQVTKGRWVATIGLIDIYQAQYCLGDGDGRCAQKAQLLFGNRAYTPTAKLLAQRIDPGGIEYDDPLIIKNEYGRILTLSARLPDGGQKNNYYLWEDGAWLPIDTQGWLKDLARQLPAGVAVRGGDSPNVDTMRAKASLYRKGDADCCPTAGVASAELGLAKRRFSLKKYSIDKTPD